MSSSYPGAVWRTLFEPGYLLTGTEGLHEFRAGFGYQFERSSNNSLSPNLDSPNLKLDWLRHGIRNTTGLSYNNSEVSTRNAGVDAAGRIVTGVRASRAFSGSWSNALSERSTLALIGGHEAVTYSGGSYINYELQTSDLKYTYALSEQSAPFLDVSRDQIMPATGGGSSVKLTRILPGLELKTEDVDWIVQAGRFKDSQENSGFLGSIRTHYTGLRSQLILTVGRQILPSGQSSFVKADQTNVGWRYALSQTINAGIDLDRSKYHILNIRNIPSLAYTSIDSSTTTAGAWIEHDLDSSWKLRTYFQHSMNQSAGFGGAFSNTLGISIGFINPDF
jgi:hypothetical protein